MDQGIDKSQINLAISDLDSSDKNVSRKALNFLLPRVGTEITVYQDQVSIQNKLVELASSSDVGIRRHLGNMCRSHLINTSGVRSSDTHAEQIQESYLHDIHILMECDANSAARQIVFLSSIGCVCSDVMVYDPAYWVPVCSTCAEILVQLHSLKPV